MVWISYPEWEKIKRKLWKHFGREFSDRNREMKNVDISINSFNPHSLFYSLRTLSPNNAKNYDPILIFEELKVEFETLIYFLYFLLLKASFVMFFFHFWFTVFILLIDHLWLDHCYDFCREEALLSNSSKKKMVFFQIIPRVSIRISCID